MLSPSADPRSPVRKPKAKQPKGLKGVLPAMAGSAVALLVVMFSLGKLPQIDNAGANLNTTLQAHNDVIVNSMIHSLPSVAVGFGVLLIGALVWVNRPAKAK